MLIYDVTANFLFWHPKNYQKWPHMSQRWQKNHPKSKNNCSLYSSNFHVERPVSRYGRLKLKFLCDRFSHCIYCSFCSIELTKSRNTWSLIAVMQNHAIWRSALSFTERNFSTAVSCIQLWYPLSSMKHLLPYLLSSWPCHFTETGTELQNWICSSHNQPQVQEIKY